VFPFLLFFAAAVSQGAWISDQGDGTYRNPVLAGDYSDPDVVRVGGDYYLAASSFTNVPGAPILHSRDLVNWTIVGHALERLEPEAHYRVPRRGGGVWAPAIRYHGGKFLIYYPDPDRGIFVVTASDPRAGARRSGRSHSSWPRSARTRRAAPASHTRDTVDHNGRVRPCPAGTRSLSQETLRRLHPAVVRSSHAASSASPRTTACTPRRSTSATA